MTMARDWDCALFILQYIRVYKQIELTEMLTALILLALKEWDMSFM